MAIEPKKDKFFDNEFSLVLSGGGALGIAHLGILSDLEKNNITPSELVGTSMGGIIGACLAMGIREEEIYKKIKEFSSVFNWIKFSFSGNSVIDNSKISKIFDNIFQNRKMSDTIIPLKLIATNMQTGNKKVFTSADNVYIKDAVLATMAIPGIFKEHTIDGEIFVDGFICENLGIYEASFTNVLAVDVLGQNSFDSDMPDNFFKTANVIEMFEKSVRLLIYNQSKTLMAHTDKNIYLIEPETKDYKTFQFHKYREIRTLGLGLI
ncbi:MAG: patatin-like phospholipase family protein [Sulfurovum sp.]